MDFALLQDRLILDPPEHQIARFWRPATASWEEEAEEEEEERRKDKNGEKRQIEK